ncbi:MAG TPA: carbonic anhydrase family protein [Algoriphagus sp.]|nr:carbonic anhydrase family protein [Algoriphagus sp.]
MKTTSNFLFSIALMAMFSCSKAPETSETTADSLSNAVVNTAPDATAGKAQGYVLPGLDHGFEQSPINIISTAEVEGKHQITMYFKDEINKIENLGHTVQLDFAEGSSIVQDDTTFAFKQTHFHTPSEHLIDGITYPMEMHIVNIMPNEDKNATPQYLVIGVLFKEGKENKFINEFLKAIPKEENETAALKAGTVKLADLFGQIPKEIAGDYYNYRGSLTTPPYTESVRWYISKHIFEASPSQIEAINKVEGNNARHVQALYGRTISAK